MRKSKKESASSEASSRSAAPGAFAKVEPKLAEVNADEIVPIYVDIPAAVTTVLGILPRLRTFRSAIVEQLPGHPVELIDELEDYALAAWYAQLVYSYASADEQATSRMAEATELRDGLLIAAEALAHRGLIDREKVASIRQASSASSVGADLSELASLLSAEWSKIAGKTAVEKRELDKAAALGQELVVALSVRAMAQKSEGEGGGDAKMTDFMDTRARAYTLFYKAYDSCRRALSYLRWNEQDADEIAPPFVKKRGPRTRSVSTSDVSTPPEMTDSEVVAETH